MLYYLQELKPEKKKKKRKKDYVGTMAKNDGGDARI
jgi:hypothetical protein